MANHTGKGISDRKLAITPPILPDEAPVTQAMDTMGTWDEAGASPYVIGTAARHPDASPGRARARESATAS